MQNMINKTQQNDYTDGLQNFHDIPCTAIGNLDHYLKQDYDTISNRIERRFRWLNEGNSRPNFQP